MKARGIVFDGIEKVEMRDMELPSPGSGDLLVETEVSGISVGTERWALLGKRPEMNFPFVTGYMGIGRVSWIGDLAREKGYQIGDRLNFMKGKISEPYQSNSWMGTHISHAVLDADNPNIIKVPEGLDPADASLSQLCCVAMQGIEMAGVSARSNVLVMGLGVIGLYAVQICRLKGAFVAGADVVESRLDVARKLKTDWVFNSRDPDLGSKLMRIAPDGFDMVIDTSSIPDVVNHTFPYLKTGGKFVLQGYYPGNSSLDLGAAALRSAHIYMPNGHDIQNAGVAMRWTKEGHLNSRDLLSHIVPPKQATDLYQWIAAGSDKFLGLAIDWRKN